MKNYREEFTKVANSLVELLKTTRSHEFGAHEIGHFEKRAGILVNIFATAERGAINLLDQWQNSAPRTFEKHWDTTRDSIQSYPDSIDRAIYELSRLAAWSYLEKYWNNPGDPTEHLLNPDSGVVLELVGMELGLDSGLSQFEILNSLSIQKKLLNELLLEDTNKKLLNFFDTTNKIVGRGKEAVDGFESKVDNAINRFEAMQSLIEKTEADANAAEEKIAKYEETLKKYHVQFGFLGLTAAFKEFFERKQKEHGKWLIALIFFGFLAIAIPLVGFFVHIQYPKSSDLVTAKSDSTKIFTGSDQKRNVATEPRGIEENKAGQSPDKDTSTPATTIAESNSGNETWWRSVISFVPLAAIEILLLYFFRVALAHFNSVQGQMLQLEMRMAACGFIEEYAKFSKENMDGGDLSKFEALIFGGIVSDVDQIPSTFDGLDQIVSVIKAIKEK